MHDAGATQSAGGEIMKTYASLIGPLLGLYYPLPDEPETVQRTMLSTSRLKNLWCSIYPESIVDDTIIRFGGSKLPDKYAKKLDYDSFQVEQIRSKL